MGVGSGGAAQSAANAGTIRPIIRSAYDQIFTYIVVHCVLDPIMTCSILVGLNNGFTSNL